MAKRNPDYEDENLQEAVDAVKEKYEPKIKQLLEEVCEEAKERGYACNGPMDWSDETYKWAVSITPQGGDVEDSVDVSVEIAESWVFNNKPGGINFSMLTVSYEGKILGTLLPYNFTDQVWAPLSDVEAIEESWDLFDSGADTNEIFYFIDQHYEDREPNPSSRKLKNKLLR